MQIWFFFNPGTGGDGVANLFEQSSDIVSFDATAEDPVDYWRVHRFVDGSPKFYAPTPDANECFRSGKRFEQIQNTLHPGYARCVASDQNCIVASHDVHLTNLLASDLQDVFCKNQIKVLLTTSDHHKANINAAIKNLRPTVKFNSAPEIDCKIFDFVLDVDRIQTDWQYVKKFSQDTGIKLDYQSYLEYQDILIGNKTFLANNFQIEEYVSCIQNESVTYKLVNTWQ